MTPEQKVAHVAAQTAAALIELESMKAANREREMHGYALAWNEDAFHDLIAKYGLDGNSRLEAHTWQQERAAIVKWFDERFNNKGFDGVTVLQTISSIAKSIKAGEHWPEGGEDEKLP
jgi:N-acetyl-anhydromuramyl-L-alanine amidase AmpD